MSEELKPCPFCGGEVLQVFVEQEMNKYYGHIYCHNCCSTGAVVMRRCAEDCENACRKAWNTRATDKELTESSKWRKKLTDEVNDLKEQRRLLSWELEQAREARRRSEEYKKKGGAE